MLYLKDLDFDELKTIEQCEWLANFAFWQIARQRGSFEARRIFTQCVKPITKRDEQLEANARLLWEYINMPKRSIRRLAVRIAKETGDDDRVVEKRIERAVKSKKVRAYLGRHGPFVDTHPTF
jgi:hypothetical protein